jgi:3-oxoadipate enol-lactonase
MQQEQKNVSVGDIDISYTQVGSGPAVVFIHGLAEDKSSWDAIVEQLAGSFTCYSVDLRGHAETTVGNPQGTAAQLADDLIGFVKTVTGPAACVGYSLGGVIVLAAALKAPELIKHAVVAGTSSKVGRAAQQFFRDRIELLKNDPSTFAGELSKDTDAQIIRARDRVDQVAFKRVAAVGAGAGYANAAQAMVGLGDAPMTEQLSAISVPVDIIHADQDVFCPAKAAEMLKAAMPNAGYYEVAGAGHLMSVDQPVRYAQAIAAALTARIS